jgi:hypothetical protein
MQLNGVANLIIDGSYDGVGTNFTFRHTVAGQTVLTLSNGTTNCEVRNSVMEASGASAAVVRIGVNSGLAVTEITFDGNHIRNRSDITQDANSLHRIGIVSIGGGDNQKNEHITITNNLFSGFSQSGVDFGLMTSVSNSGNLEYYLGATAFAGTNNGSYFNISNNKFYAPISLSGGFVCVPLKFNPGAGSHSNIISGNVIGGSDSSNSGTMVYSSNNGFSGIYVGVGGTTDAEATIISDNVIQNISLTGLNSTWQRFVGIETVGVSRVKILNNTVGSLTENNSIVASSNGFNNYQFISWLYGIWYCSTGNAQIEGNIVSNMNSTASGGITVTSGIRVGARENWYAVAPTTLLVVVAGQVKVNNNIVANLTTPSRSWRSTSFTAPQHPGALSGIVVISNTAGNEINNNQVYNLRNTVPGSDHRATCVVAIAVDGSGPAGHGASGSITGNIIYNLNNEHQVNGNDSNRPEVIGVSVGMMIATTPEGTTQGRGSYVVSNNMISLAPEVPANSTMVVGIMDQVQGPSSTKVYNNTVYIGGTGINSLHASAAYFKFPNRGRAVPLDGASEVYNNIFINERTGMTNAYAMALLVNGEANFDSDYNLFISSEEGQVAAWNSTAGTLSEWQSNSSGDVNSYYASINNSSPTNEEAINLTELFVDILSDLHLIDSEEQWPLAWVENMGTPLSAVTVDIDNEPRNPMTPTLGADEFYEVNCIEPSVEITTTELIVCEGDSLVVSSVVSGTEGVIQWLVRPVGSDEWTALADGDEYSGVTANELIITAATVSMNGNEYRIALTNDCGEANAEITLTVNANNIYYADADGDGKGDINNTVQACEQPEGYVTNSSDCDDSEALVWLAKPVEIDIDIPVSFCIDGDALVLDAVSPTGGTWSGNGVDDGSFTPSVAGLGSHMLSYFVTGDGTCELPATQTVAVEVINCTAVDELSEQAIMLYPNRVETTFRVEATSLQYMVVMDMNGRVMASHNIQGTAYNYDMSSYPAGTYFVKVVSHHRTQVFKLIKI